ncbi:MAG TPA: DUF4395 domain-containing protein [Bacteroidales bacterium]|jgi:hypothetical protein|nr:DUF4395 domain-containing protein [Bacteroidales bacterium]|tara:strand:+ start:139 stop:627 length:489 start_codon:yes stop_codon:yes gene_type:complete
MKKYQSLISRARIKRLKVQGYSNYSDEMISELAFGNRFAYGLCSAILLIGVILANIPLLAIMMIIALFGVILPYHPFDYIYNYLIRGMINKPKLTRRSKQLKFACGIATIWIAAVIYLFYAGFALAGYIAGGVLSFVAILVSTTDICIPSIIFNFLFKVKTK